MSPSANCLPLQVSRPFSISNTAVLVAVFCLLLASLSKVSSAQNTKGLPEVGNGSAPASSQMLIDATAFSGASDMCASIATACSKLGSSASYPLGATIDARGFTGNQVCRSGNITKMLFQCVPQGSSTGATGGKLLLGEVNLYADGPTSGNYTDGSSGIGTPALIIPGSFWGIEGVSRGATVPVGANMGPGTWLSVCTGTNTPVGTGHLPPAPGSPSCSTAFPIRTFTVNSATVVGNVMTMNVSPALNWGVNIYPGELVMMKGNNVIAPAENGTYKVQNNSPDTTINVTVPTGTPSCTPPSGTCATVYLGTPILGFASSNTPYNDSSCFPSGCVGFGEHIQNLGFNCQKQDGCIGWQNLYAQEESGADTFVINNYSFVGVDVHHNAQNFGPILNAEIYTGNGTTNCSEGTTGIYIGDKSTRGLNGWTINVPAESSDPAPPPACAGGTVPTAALLLDASNTEARNGHCEGFVNCVLMGANNDPSGGFGGQGEHVDGIEGPPSGAGTNGVQISGNFSGNKSFRIERIRKHGDLHTVVDNINHITLDDAYVGSYAWDSNGSALNILTTNTSIRNRFDSGVRTSSLASGLSANSDLTGELTFSSATTASYTFVANFGSHPECTVVPLFDAGTTHFWVTYAPVPSSFQLTIHSSSAVTGSVSYTCSARN